MSVNEDVADVVMIGSALDPNGFKGNRAAVIVDFDGDGCPMVEIDGHVVAARATIAIQRDDLGREAMVSLLNEDPRQPVVTGLFVDPQAPARRRTVEIRADGLDFEAASKIVFKCGKSSITLHRDGKIVLQGKHLLSRASGVNRVRGGTIELN